MANVGQTPAYEPQPYQQPYQQPYESYQQPQQQTYQPQWTPSPQQQWSAPPQTKSGNKKTIMVVVGVLLLVGVGLTIYLLMRSNSSSYETSYNNGSSSNTAKTASTNMTTVRATPTPTNTPSPAQELDIAGTWVGDYQQSPATLIINNRAGDSFSGTLDSQGYLVEVNITVNQNTRQMTLAEKRMIYKSSTADAEWQMDTSNRSISSDGKTMGGSGIDLTNKQFSWSFSKK